MTNAELRRKIMALLYESCTDNPYSRVTPKEFKETLGVGLKELHFNMIYLEEKGYVELQQPFEGTMFVTARITAKGIDVVENEYELNVFLPAAGAAAKSALDLDASFNGLIAAARNAAGLSDDSQELLIEELNEIRRELASGKPGYAAVKANVDRVRQRSFEIGQRLSEILKDPVLARALANAAREELGG